VSIIHFQSTIAGGGTSYDLTAGGSGGGETGFLVGQYGSIAPTSFRGQPIRGLFTANLSSFTLLLNNTGPALGQDFFNTLQVIGGPLLGSADVFSYSNIGGIYDQWNWNTANFVFVNGQSYDVIIG